LSTRFENAVNAALAIAALAVAAGFVRREFLEKPAHSADENDRRAAVFIPRWADLMQDGLLIGPADAKVKIIEFADVECRFCADWHRSVLKKAVANKDVSYTMIHLPLPNHRFSRQAAQGVECSASQGRAMEFLDSVYSRQDSIGLTSWVEYARRAKVAHLARFAQCMSENPHQRIDAGLKQAAKIGVGVTPTVLVNGWLLPRAPDPEALTRIMRLINDGKSLSHLNLE
jgi:protein-disulfide isomerase